MAAQTTIAQTQESEDPVWTQGPVQLARGRQARDPQNVTTSYNVSSIEDFETSLREYLNNPPEQPEHSECQLSFWIGATFLVREPNGSQSTPRQQHPPPPQQPQPQPHVPAGYQPASLDAHYGGPTGSQHPFQSNHNLSHPANALSLPYNGGGAAANDDDDADGRVPMSILEALAPTSDPKEKMRKQRSIAKACVDSIQKVDGYRYSFHNCWNSREDDSFRFSYYCNDSLLNKDRAANGKGAKLGKRATKPVYDCRGVLSVKFSASKQTLDVFYKHLPIHKTYEERAPAPRRDSKRRKFLEENDPDALVRIANRPKPPKPPSSDDVNGVRQKKKKKKDNEKQNAANSIESDLRAQSLRSLLELIQTDPSQEAAQEQPQNDPESPQQPARRRPRVSCDSCKTKKIKCDGVRPCQACNEKGRQCIYTEQAVDDNQRSGPAPSQPQNDASSDTQSMSELEKLRAELEQAKSQIRQLEAEKTRANSASSTPSHPAPPPPQLQTPQYLNPQTYTPMHHAPHPAMSRPMQTHSPVTAQLQGASTGMTPTQDDNSPYGRDFRWPPFYGGYQPAMQPPQQADQWATARGTGVYR